MESRSGGFAPAEDSSSASDARDLAAAEKERGIDPDNVNTHPRNYTDAEWDRRRNNMVTAPGKAFAALGDAFVNNEDFRNAFLGTLAAGAAPIALATAGPTLMTAGSASIRAAVGSAFTYAASHPKQVERATDFALGYLDPGPPPSSRAGAVGFGLSKLQESIEE